MDAVVANVLMDIKGDIGGISVSIANIEKTMLDDKLAAKKESEKIYESIESLSKRTNRVAKFVAKVKHSWIIAVFFGSVAGAVASLLIKVDRVKHAVGGFFNNGS